MASFYEHEPKRTPKIIPAEKSTCADADSCLWPQEIPIPTLRSDILNFSIFFALQLATIAGLVLSNIFRWFVALILISYVVVTAVRGYDQLELLLHETDILKGCPKYSDTGSKKTK